MCEFIKEIKDKTQFTGYKVACKRRGKYYSPATGIEYKPGKIKIPLCTGKNKLCDTFREVLCESTGCYKEHYKGLTAVFVNLCDAKTRQAYWRRSMKSGYEMVILKMTIQKTKDKNCYVGDYQSALVYIGSRIRSFKEIDKKFE